MSATSGGEVSLHIGDRQISSWLAVQVSRSCEGYPNSFTLTAADPYPNDPTRAIVVPGKAGEIAKLYIGSDLVITGYVDRYQVFVGPQTHTVTVIGRGLTEDLVDCSADLIKSPKLRGSQLTFTSALALAQALADPFNLKVRNATGDPGLVLHAFNIYRGETSSQIIERVCRYAGFMAYEDVDGTLVLDRVGTKKHASGFTMPGNMEAATSSLSIDQRFTDYTVVWTSIGGFFEQSPIPPQRGYAHDPTMPPGRYRPKIIVSEQVDPGSDIAERRAKWEYARRLGRSQAIALTCDSWRDTDGKLWTPNMLAPVSSDALKIKTDGWIIGSVTYRKDMSGTHADLVLMPPEAFSVEPAPLGVWDNELTNSKPSGSSSSASTAGGGAAKPTVPLA